MTVRQLMEMLSNLPEEHLDKEFYIAESDGYTYSSPKDLGSVDFTEDGMVDRDYNTLEGNTIVAHIDTGGDSV